MKTFLFISLITLCFACGNRSIKSSSTAVSNDFTSTGEFSYIDYDKKEIGVLPGKIPIKRYTYDAKTSIYNPYRFVSDSVTIIQIDQDTVWAKQPNSNWYNSLQWKYIRKQLVHLVQQHPKKVIYAIQLDTSFYPRFDPQPKIVIAINPRLSRETYLDNEDTTLGDSIITNNRRKSHSNGLSSI